MITTALGLGRIPLSSAPGEPFRYTLARQDSFSSQLFGSLSVGSIIVREKPSPSVMERQPSLYSKSRIVRPTASRSLILSPSLARLPEYWPAIVTDVPYLAWNAQMSFTTTTYSPDSSSISGKMKSIPLVNSARFRLIAAGPMFLSSMNLNYYHLKL